jgi:uncharacterized protein (UPF0276 family)
LIESGSSLISVVEIEPQMFWRTRNHELAFQIPSAVLERFRAFPQRKIVHGVSAPVGGSLPPRVEYTSAFVAAILDLKAEWASEHLSFNRVASPQGEFATGFMLPPLQTSGGVERAVATIRSVASALPVPFAVETPVNYLHARLGELSDGRFVGTIAEMADCGILLDLHNIWTNECNGRQAARDFLAEIPLDRVWEVHLAGGNELDGYWLDAHSGPVPGKVMELAKEILPMLPNLHAIIFEILSTFVPQTGLATIHSQLEKIADLWGNCRLGRNELRSARVPSGIEEFDRVSGGSALDPSAWERAMGELIARGRKVMPLSEELSRDPGIPLMQKLVWDFRAGMIVDVLRLTTRLILLTKGNRFLSDLVDTFSKVHPPELFASAEAESFMRFLRTKELDIPYLLDTLAFEEAAIESYANAEVMHVRLRCDPVQLLSALSAGHPPTELTAGDYDVEITPDGALLSG